MVKIRRPFGRKSGQLPAPVHTRSEQRRAAFRAESPRDLRTRVRSLLIILRYAPSQFDSRRWHDEDRRGSTAACSLAITAVAPRHKQLRTLARVTNRPTCTTARNHHRLRLPSFTSSVPSLQLQVIKRCAENSGQLLMHPLRQRSKARCKLARSRFSDRCQQTYERARLMR